MSSDKNEPTWKHFSKYSEWQAELEKRREYFISKLSETYAFKSVGNYGVWMTAKPPVTLFKDKSHPFMNIKSVKLSVDENDKPLIQFDWDDLKEVLASKEACDNLIEKIKNYDITNRQKHEQEGVSNELLKEEFFKNPKQSLFTNTQKEKLKELAKANAWLVEAITAQNNEVIQALLQPFFKIDVNAKDLHGNTPLSAAIETGNWRLVDYLIKNKAVEFQANYIQSLLRESPEEDKNNRMKLMHKIIFTPAIKVVGKQGNIPQKNNPWESNKSLVRKWLKEAIAEGNTDAITKLFMMGAVSEKDIQALDKSDVKQFHQLAKNDTDNAWLIYANNNHAIGLKNLLEALKLKERFLATPTAYYSENQISQLKEMADREGWLVEAIRDKNVDRVKVLITQLKVDLNAEHPEGGRTPLIEAAMSPDPKFGYRVSALLLDNNAYINCPRKRDGCTPFSAAINAKNERLIIFLIQKGVNINVHYTTQITTPLYDVLVKKVKDKNGRSLEFYSKEERIHLIEKIIFNSKVKTFDRSSNTEVVEQLQILAQNEKWFSKAIEQYQQDLSKKSNPKSYYAIKKLFTCGAVTIKAINALHDDSKDMLKKMAEVNQWRNEAEKKGDFVLIGVLDHLKANDRANDPRELIEAIKENNLVTAKELIKKNPGIVNQYDRDGLTPLHSVVKNNPFNKQEFIKLLIENKANPDAVNSEGKRPIDLGDHDSWVNNILLTPYPNWNVSSLELSEEKSRLYHLVAEGIVDNDCELTFESAQLVLHEKNPALSLGHPLNFYVQTIEGGKKIIRLNSEINLIYKNKQEYDQLQKDILIYRKMFDSKVVTFNRDSDEQVVKQLQQLAQKGNWLANALEKYQEDLKQEPNPDSYYAIKKLFTSGAVTIDDINKLDDNSKGMLKNMAETNGWFKEAKENSDTALQGILHQLDESVEKLEKREKEGVNEIGENNFILEKKKEEFINEHKISEKTIQNQNNSSDNCVFKQSRFTIEDGFTGNNKVLHGESNPKVNRPEKTIFQDILNGLPPQKQNPTSSSDIKNNQLREIAGNIISGSVSMAVQQARILEFFAIAMQKRIMPVYGISNKTRTAKKLFNGLTKEGYETLQSLFSEEHAFKFPGFNNNKSKLYDDFGKALNNYYHHIPNGSDTDSFRKKVKEIRSIELTKDDKEVDKEITVLGRFKPTPL